MLVTIKEFQKEGDLIKDIEAGSIINIEVNITNVIFWISNARKVVMSVENLGRVEKKLGILWLLNRDYCKNHPANGDVIWREETVAVPT